MGHYYWDLLANRVVWSDELYRIYGLTPQEGPIDMAMVREMIHPDDRENVFRAAEEAVRSGVPQGTGMGLAITRSIVESYGGRVWAEPNDRAGAIFYLTIPIEAEAHA